MLPSVRVSDSECRRTARPRSKCPALVSAINCGRVGENLGAPRLADDKHICDVVAGAIVFWIHVCRSNLPHRLSEPTTVDENAQAFIPSRLVRLGQRRQTYERLSAQPALDACVEQSSRSYELAKRSKVIAKTV